MSKMSNLALELDELAVELGFENLEDAMNNGYEWVQDYDDEPHLVKIEDEQKKAHEAWLEEKACALEGLEDLRKRIPCDWTETIDVLDRAIEFIKGAHD